MAQERRLSMTAGILPPSAIELERMFLLPVSGKPDIHRIIAESSQDLINVIPDMSLEPFEKFALKAGCFYCFDKRSAFIALQEYKAFLLGGYIHYTRKNQLETAKMIQKYFNEVFPIFPRTKVQQWYLGCSFPSIMSTIKTYEKRYPHAFDENMAKCFFQKGFGSLLACCFMNRNSNSGAIAGSKRLWKYHVGNRGANSITKYAANYIEEFDIAKKYQDYWDVTNVPVARYLECIQHPELTVRSLDTLPHKTTSEFLHVSLKILQERYTGRNVHSISLSAEHNLPHSIALKWMYYGFETRGLGNVNYQHMPSEVRLNFGRGYQLQYMIDKLDEELQSERVENFNPVRTLLDLTQIESQLEAMK